MSTDVDEAGQSTTSLVTGILGDFQHLVEQQLRLTRREVESELEQRLSALWIVALGMSILFVDAILLSLSLVHLLHWLSSSEIDPAGLPLWACYAVVAALVLVIGGIVDRSTGRKTTDHLRSFKGANGHDAIARLFRHRSNAADRADQIV